MTKRATEPGSAETIEQCQPSRKTEPRPTMKTEPAPIGDGAPLSDSFRLSFAAGGVGACSSFCGGLLLIKNS